MNSPKPELKDLVKLLPTEPGVYRFYDRLGTIIYIGKAKNLKNRVSQYFQSPDSLTTKTRVMVLKIERMDHTVVSTEEEALLLENNLIKQYRPKYNIMLKDDKTYPWICVKKEPFPRVFMTRKLVKDGSMYFGPYSAVNFAYKLLDLINSLYYLRNCKLNLTTENITSRKFKPCLNFHIGKCKAPCIGEINNDEYNDQIKNIVSILKGETSELEKEFRDKMLKASAEHLFEDAHKFKTKLELIQNYNSKSIVVNPSIDDSDVFSIVFEGNLAFGNFLRVVKGSIIQSLNLEFRLQIEEDQATVMSSFIAEILDKTGKLSRNIIVPFKPDETFTNHIISIPLKGDKLKLLELSIKNAKIFKLEKIKQEQILRPEEHKNRVLSAVQKDLSLKELPIHIECFDNSNIQGKHAVSSCVVFKNGIPSKSDYRHFNIKTVEGPDDFASMREVVGRRYSRLLNEHMSLPQLIVIDGGRGQLNSAYEVLAQLGLSEQIPIIGIAKRLEELIIPGDPDPLFLDKNSPTLKLLMQMRDEAHRFGITHHRDKRSKAQTESVLIGIKGIGEKREKMLLSHFKSVKKIKEATIEEIASIVGLKTAELIKSKLSNH